MSSAAAGQAAQHRRDLAFLARQFQHAIGDRRPSGPGVRPVRHRARRARQAQPNARPDGGERAKVGDAAVGDLAALVHHHDAVDLPLQFGQRVRRQQHRRAVAAQVADDLVKALAQRRVEAGGRLVQQQRARSAQQGLRQAEALAHAFRIGADAAMSGRRDADALEQRGVARRPAGASAARRTPASPPRSSTDAARRPPADSRARAAPARPRRRRGPRPRTSTLPELGRTSPSIILISVVLPAPLWPTRPTHSPPRQSQIDVAHGLVSTVAARDAAHDDGFARHGANRAKAGGCGGFISGAVSITPPGWIAGNAACAHLTTCTAGLLSSILAAGARQMTWSIRSLGR